MMRNMKRLRWGLLLALICLTAFGGAIWGQTGPRGTPPAITFIDFPRTISADDGPVIGRVYYEDLENDLVRAEFRVVDAIDFRGFAMDLGGRLQNDGVFDFFEFDILPASADRVTLEVVLIDELNLESAPRRFSFNVLGPGGAPPPSTSGSNEDDSEDEPGGTPGGLFPSGQSSTPTAEIRVEPPSLRFEASPNGANPAQQALLITSRTADNTTFFWKARVDVAWLTLSRTDGPAPATISAEVNISGLTPGTYTGTITVSAENTVNESLDIPVTLVVGSTATGPGATGSAGAQGQLVVLVFQTLEFVEPEQWAISLQAGCLVHTNRSAAASAVRIVLQDGNVRIFSIPSGNQVLVCGTTVLVDTR